MSGRSVLLCSLPERCVHDDRRIHRAPRHTYAPLSHPRTAPGSRRHRAPERPGQHRSLGQPGAPLGAGRRPHTVPAAYGGLWDGTALGGIGAFTRAIVEISAGDGPTGQNWATTGLVSREIFDESSALPEETRKELADRLLNKGLRLVASNAETGVNGKVTARPVDGGVVLGGTKSFNTNSGGLGIANVGCVLQGEQPGPHHVLVELGHPDVELHGDWDNMGQRGTRSQTITYHDVFVPDGWHYAAHTPSPAFLGAVMLLHSGLMQGIGDGALDALVQYVRTMKRGALPQYATAADDPLILRRVGDLSKPAGRIPCAVVRRGRPDRGRRRRRRCRYLGGVLPRQGRLRGSVP